MIATSDAGTLFKTLSNKLLYFYRRDNKLGYDQISFCCYSKVQADQLLEQSVTNPSEWFYDHLVNIDLRNSEFDDDY